MVLMGEYSQETSAYAGDLFGALRRAVMAHKRTTGKKAASNAGKILADKNSTKAEKSAAASALAQTKSKKKGGH